MNPDLIRAMRFGAADSHIVHEYMSHGDPLRPDLCNRTFVLYLGNGFVDKSLNTAIGVQDVATCERFLRGYCYRQFNGGQMEQVLDDLVCVSYLKSPAAVLSCVHALREFGIIGEIRCDVEYVNGYPVEFKSY